MKLKAVIGTLEGLSESIAALYKKEGDNFILDLDGVDDHPSVQNLSKTVKTIRTEKNEFEKQLKSLQDKVAGLDIDNLKGIDPDEYKRSNAELVALKLEQENRNIQKLKDEKNWEKLELQLKDQQTKDLAAIVAAHSSEKDSLLKQMESISGETTKNLSGMQASLKKHLKDKELTQELARAKGNITILTPHISPFIDVRPNSAGEYEAIVIGADSNQRFNNAGKPMSIEELILEFKEKPEFKGEGVFEVQKQSGGSGSDGFRGDGSAVKNPYSKEHWNVTEQGKLFAKDKVVHDQMKAAAAA